MKNFLIGAVALVALFSLGAEAEQQNSSNPAFSSNARLTNNTRFVDLDEPQLAVTTLSAANTIATLTIPASGAGLFHYITALKVMRTCTTAIVGTAILGYTSTNLPGSLAWSSGNACAVGSTNLDIDLEFPRPLKSSVANTATTIVAPAAGVAGQVRLTAYYFPAL